MVVEKVYENYPQIQLPANLTGRPVVSSRNQRSSAFGSPYLYLPGPFPGWTPYPAWNAPAPYPQYGPPSPSNALPYPPHSTDGPSSLSHRSAGDGDNEIEYPSITEFFTELMETESSEHYFTSYVEAFRDEGYYRVDELAAEDLTIGHMVEVIPQLKEGTARVIKRKALAKVKKLKSRGKK